MAAVWTPSIPASLVGSVHSDVPDATVIGGVQRALAIPHVQFRFRRPFLITRRDIHPALVCGPGRLRPGLKIPTSQHPDMIVRLRGIAS